MKWHRVQSIVSNDYGRCSYYFVPGYVPCIYSLSVKKEHRRKGHARELLRAVIREIKESGYAGDINIEANPQDESISADDLKAFYEREGLTVINNVEEKGAT